MLLNFKLDGLQTDYLKDSSVLLGFFNVGAIYCEVFLLLTFELDGLHRPIILKILECCYIPVFCSISCEIFLILTFGLARGRFISHGQVDIYLFIEVFCWVARVTSSANLSYSSTDIYPLLVYRKVLLLLWTSGNGNSRVPTRLPRFKIDNFKQKKKSMLYSSNINNCKTNADIVENWVTPIIVKRDIRDWAAEIIATKWVFAPSNELMNKFVLFNPATPVLRLNFRFVFLIIYVNICQPINVKDVNLQWLGTR